MYRTFTPFVLLIASFLALCGCDSFFAKPANLDKVDGYEPVYAAAGAPNTVIMATGPRPTNRAGKISVLGNRLFQVEQDSGIHIIDYSDRANPVKIGFLRVPGCGEVSVKGSDVYANNYEDLVILDLSAYPDVRERGRIPEVFPSVTALAVPPETGTYFVCPDGSMGRVVGWTKKKLLNPRCRN